MPEKKTDGRGGYHRGGGFREGSGRPLVGESKRVTTSICIEKHLLEKLDALAAKTGETRSDIINRLLRAM